MKICLSKLNEIIMSIVLLSDLLMYGVAYHHAGMEVCDRKIIEGAFTDGDLPVLCKYFVSQFNFESQNVNVFWEDCSLELGILLFPLLLCEIQELLLCFTCTSTLWVYRHIITENQRTFLLFSIHKGHPCSYVSIGLA